MITSRTVLPVGLALALALACASCALATRDDAPQTAHNVPPQDVKWFHSGWYAGATVGTAIADAKASHVESDLADRGFDATVSLDATNVGWKVFGGYRFDEPWAVELAVVDLGVVDSTIDSDAVDVDALVDAVADVHPFSGAGMSLSGIYFPIERQRVDLGIKAGVWLWDAEVDANAATGETAEIKEDGVDLLFGLVGLVDLGKGFSARVEWEHYFLDNNDVDYLAVGLQYGL